MIGADRLALIREVNQALGRELGGRTQLGSPGWEYMDCPSCGTSLRYFESVPLPYYPYGPPSPYDILSCPACGADLGVRGLTVQVVTAIPPPPTYTCPHCDAMFTHESLLSYHILTQHGPPPPPVKVSGFEEWLKKYWPWVTMGSLGFIALLIVASR